MKIFLSKRITNNKKLSVYAIGVYIALRCLMQTSRHIYCINPKILYFELHQSSKWDQQQLKYIHQGLRELTENRIIKLIESKVNEMIVDLGNLHVKTSEGNYIILKTYEVSKIMNLKVNNKYNLLRYFTFMIGMLSKVDQYDIQRQELNSRALLDMPLNELAMRYGTTENTIIKYNKVLESNRLIYVNRQDDYIIDGNNIKSPVNVYGRPENRFTIDSYANTIKELLKTQEGYRLPAKNTRFESNRKRGLGMKYKQMVQGKEYDIETVQEIYQYVLEENKKYITMSMKHNDESYTENLRDVSIFEKYDLEYWGEESPMN